jgi:hypothetical protein
MQERSATQLGIPTPTVADVPLLTLLLTLPQDVGRPQVARCMCQRSACMHRPALGEATLLHFIAWVMAPCAPVSLLLRLWTPGEHPWTSALTCPRPWLGLVSGGLPPLQQYAAREAGKRCAPGPR